LKLSLPPLNPPMPETQESLLKYLQAFALGDIIYYGELRVKVRNGKITLLTVAKDTKAD